MIEARKVGQNRFVGYSRVVERERANEIPIACNAVGVRRMSRREERECDHDAPNQHLICSAPLRAKVYLAALRTYNDLGSVSQNTGQ
jgi:hypothetical protein